MAKRGSSKRSVAVLALVALAAVGGVGLYFWHLRVSRDQVPEALVPDIQDGSRLAAHVDRLTGQAYFRPATPDDDRVGTMPPATLPPGMQPLTVGTNFTLATLVRAEAKSRVEFTTEGTWYLALDGLGAIVFQDARRSQDGSKRVVSVYVQQGTFRGKSSSGADQGHFLVVSTAAAQVRVLEGEIGMNVGPDGHGTMWIASGRAIATWADGHTKELGLRGLEHL